MMLRFTSVILFVIVGLSSMKAQPQEIKKMQKEAIVRYLGSSELPQIYKIRKMPNEQVRYTNSYSLTYKFEEAKQEWVPEYKLLSGTDTECRFMQKSLITIPESVGKDDIVFDKIDIDFVRGISVIKVKKDTSYYKNNPPPDEFADRVLKDLEVEKKGKYLVNYESHVIMGDEDTFTSGDKLSSTARGIISAIAIVGGIGVLYVVFY